MVKHRFYGLFHNILIPHRPHLNHHLTTEAQGLRYSDRANYLVFVACHSITNYLSVLLNPHTPHYTHPPFCECRTFAHVSNTLLLLADNSQYLQTNSE